MSDEVGGGRTLSDEEILAATPRGTGGREVQIGAFVLVGLITFVVILFWMTDPAMFRGRHLLVTEVSNAGGIRAGDPVQMYGVNLGRISRFEMVDEGRVFITLEIFPPWQIPVGSYTRMGAAGMFGGRTMEIVSSGAAQYYMDGDTLRGEGAAGDGLLGAVDQLSVQATQVLGSIDSLLNPETVGSIQGSASALETLLTDLSELAKDQRVALQDLTESLRGAAQGLEEASAAGPDIASAVARADSAMAVLTTTGENLDAATESLRSVLARMDRGEGTLGRLSTDETLYVSLSEAAASLTTLLEDLQAHPNKYINISIF